MPGTQCKSACILSPLWTEQKTKAGMEAKIKKKKSDSSVWDAEERWGKKKVRNNLYCR